MGKKELDKRTEFHRLHEWLDAVGGHISLGQSKLISIETSESGNKLSILLKKNKPIEKPTAIPRANEPPLIAPDDGPWELDGGFKFKKNDDKTRRSMSGIACLPNSSGPRLCLAVFDEGGEARYLTLTDNGYSTDNEKVVLLPGNGELDAEGAATDGRYFYVTGSHSVKREDGAANPDSRHVIRLRVPLANVRKGLEASPDGETADFADTDALWKILKRVPGLKEYVGDPVCKKGSETRLGKGSVNIEGLAVKNGRLFFGLRSPAVGGAAKILSVDADQLFSGGDADPKICTLMLGSGQAVRDLEAVSDGILILAGPDEAETSKNAGWAVARWDGQNAAAGVGRAKILARLNLQTVKMRRCDKKIKPEALAVIEDTPGAPYKAVIFSDGMCDGGPVVFTVPR